MGSLRHADFGGDYWGATAFGSERYAYELYPNSLIVFASLSSERWFGFMVWKGGFMGILWYNCGMEKIKAELTKIVKRLYNAETQVEVTLAPKETGADWASNVAMKLAKVARKNPILIAEEIKAELEQEWKKEGDQVKNMPEVNIAAPGFLNFISPDEYYFEKIQRYAEDFGAEIAKRYSLHDISEKGENAPDDILGVGEKRDSYAGKTVVAEFSDPNPFKVLHVGHLYTSIVGDSVARLLETAGAKVVRANFGGDVGLHVAKTIYCMKLQNMSSVEARPANPSSRVSGALSPRESGSSPEEHSATSDNMTIANIAECYVRGTKAYEEDEKAKAEITRLNKVIYALAELGEEKSRERLELEMIAEDFELSTAEVAQVAELYWRGRTLSYEYFKDFYAKIGVKFDKFYPESTVADKGLEEVRAHVPGVYEESDGAIVYRGEKKGLHTRVFINREGVPTYETKDVGLIFTKWQDFHFDESVVITGNEQLDYMKVVLASVEDYAPELAERTRHLTHGLVKLKGGVKMSSRKGNFLKAVDVINMIQEELRQTSSDEALNSADEIALAALKYAFLRYKMGGDIVFDPKESVAMTGNSGVYLLYSAVRAKKVLAKSDELSAQSAGEYGSSKESPSLSPKRVSALQDSIVARSASTIFERNLSRKVVQYEDVLDEAILEKAPYKICTYLYELAQEFSRFYENVKVAGSEREAELTKLVRAYLKVMEHGLGLLGIEVPEKM